MKTSEVQQAAHPDVEDVEVDESGYQPAWKRKNLQKELEEIDAIEATAIAIRQGEWEKGVDKVWMFWETDSTTKSVIRKSDK